MHGSRPEAVNFVLDESESKKIRTAIDPFGTPTPRMRSLLFVCFAAGLNGLLRMSGHAWRNPVDAAFVFYAIAGVAAVFAVSRWRSASVRSDVATVVSFEESAIEIDRPAADGRHDARRVALARVGSVQLLEDAIVVIERGGRTGVAIPRRAAADRGAAIAAYFESRLVGPLLLRRGSSTATTIVNTRREMSVARVTD